MTLLQWTLKLKRFDAHRFPGHDALALGARVVSPDLLILQSGHRADVEADVVVSRVLEFHVRTNESDSIMPVMAISSDLPALGLAQLGAKTPSQIRLRSVDWLLLA